MFILFECASCVIVAAIIVTLLFAVSALLIVLDEGANILGRLARRMTGIVYAFFWRDGQS